MVKSQQNTLPRNIFLAKKSSHAKKKFKFNNQNLGQTKNLQTYVTTHTKCKKILKKSKKKCTQFTRNTNKKATKKNKLKKKQIQI